MPRLSLTTPPTRPLLYSVKQFLHLTCMSKATYYRLNLPTIKVGELVRISVDTLDAVLRGDYAATLPRQAKRMEQLAAAHDARKANAAARREAKTAAPHLVEIADPRPAAKVAAHKPKHRRKGKPMPAAAE